MFFSQKTKFSFVQIYSSAIGKGVTLGIEISLRNVSSIEKEK